MSCGPSPLQIYIVSESRSALNLSPEVIEYLKSKNDITYYRLLYSRAPFFFLKFSFPKGALARTFSFSRKISAVNMSSVMTVFLILLLCFHQGIVYDIIYNEDSSQPTEVLEVGESLSLVFRNYGVEAWRWVLTESDLQAIKWLNSQSPEKICADLSRTYMLNSRINTLSEKNNSVVISFYPVQRF